MKQSLQQTQITTVTPTLELNQTVTVFGHREDDFNVEQIIEAGFSLGKHLTKNGWEPRNYFLKRLPKGRQRLSYYIMAMRRLETGELHNSI